jgi:hypothetical protein
MGDESTIQLQNVSQQGLGVNLPPINCSLALGVRFPSSVITVSFVTCLSGELKPTFLLLDAPAIGEDRKNIGDDDAGPCRALRDVGCSRYPTCDDAASPSN